MGHNGLLLELVKELFFPFVDRKFHLCISSDCLPENDGYSAAQHTVKCPFRACKALLVSIKLHLLLQLEHCQ